MNTKTLLEIFGYIGSALVVVSMLMSSIVKLRVVNTIGSVISGIYAVICGAIPLALMNACLIVINAFNLYRLLKNKKVYDLVPSNASDSLVSYFLSTHEADILRYFPGYSPECALGSKAYVVCCEGNPAGLLLGEEKDGVFTALIDYSTPFYRDCSVGQFLYAKLPQQGVRALRFAGQLSPEHLSYITRMGFVSESGAYVKHLG